MRPQGWPRIPPARPRWLVTSGMRPRGVGVRGGQVGLGLGRAAASSRRLVTGDGAGREPGHRAVQGLTPRSPVRTVPPILVTLVPAKTAYAAAEFKLTSVVIV